MTTLDLAAIEARTEAARVTVQQERMCGECGALDPIAQTIGGREFHVKCLRAARHSQHTVVLSRPRLEREPVLALTEDIEALVTEVRRLTAQAEERGEAVGALAKLRDVALRYVTAWRAEITAKMAWRAGCGAEQIDKEDGGMDDYDGPLTAAYDDAIDERIVALKLLARAVTP